MIRIDPGRARVWVPALALLTLAAFWLRLYGIDFQSLWRDETDALQFARKDLLGHLDTFRTQGENGALYFALLGLWVRVAGATELALRLPSAVLGVLTVPLAAILGRRLLGPGAGIVAAALLAFSPYHVWYSQEAKMYTALAADTTAALLALLWALEKGQWWRWFLYLALVSVGYYLHLLSAFQVFVHLAVGSAALWMRPEWRPQARGFAYSLGILLAPYLPIAVWQIALVANPPVSPYPVVSGGEVSRVLTYAFSVGSTPVPSPLLVFGHLLLLTSALFLFASRLDRGRGGWFPLVALLLALIIPIAGILLLQLRYPLFQDRYLISSLVPYELLLGAGAAALWSRARPGAVLALLLVAWTSAVSIRWESSTPIKSDFRGAARVVLANREPHDRVMFVRPYVENTFRYYAGDLPTTLLPPDVGPFPPELLNQGLDAPEIVGLILDRVIEQEVFGPLDVDADSDSPVSLWLILSEVETSDPEGLITAALDERAEDVTSFPFTLVEVRRYELPRP